MIEAAREALGSVPLLVMPGLIVFVLASAADLAFHLAPLGWGEMLEGYLGGDGYIAHMGIMAGMILTVLGLIVWGATGQRHTGAKRSDGFARRL